MTSVLLLLASTVAQQADTQKAPQSAPEVTLLRTYAAEEATQGVAVDEHHFYAITNRRIGKYRRDTGAKVAAFQDPEGGQLIHMNGGIVHQGLLYCSHSNFPGVPHQNSIEVFDTKDLTHLRTIPMPADGIGSLVWPLPDPQGQGWWVAFGHYNGRGGEPGRTNDQSVLVRFDQSWKEAARYTFDQALVARWDGMTASGGVFDHQNRLWATGHHATELHLLEFQPDNTLKLVLVVKTPAEGQGIAFCPKTETLWQIQRKTKEVLQLRLPG